MPWTEDYKGPSSYGNEVQDAQRAKVAQRGRSVRNTPFRQLNDRVVDPPIANVFGAIKGRTRAAGTFGRAR